MIQAQAVCVHTRSVMTCPQFGPCSWRAPDFGGAVHGVRGADRDDMLVNMIPVHVVQMAVMANSRMPAVRAMLVDMVGMLPLGAGGHEILLLLRLRSRCLCLSAECSIALCTSCRTWASETP